MKSLDPQLAKRSDLRKVSLTRLEKAVAQQLARGEALTSEMKYLAGLLRIQYVFFYPETGDIVIAGPAEGFVEDLTGRVRGLTTGRPVLELQDLIVALRAYPPNGNKLNVIGVSIDPTQEGLNRMRQYYASIAGRVRPGDANRIAQGMKQSLGQQVVRIDGISPRTHFAQVMVEADYRMKLIGIGLVAPSVKFKNYVERANSRTIQRNALERWYFTPNYKCLRVSKDNLAMAMNGWGVRLISEGELVQEGGIRVGSATVNKASQAFCQAFTDKYPQMASLEPVYAQLRNLIDLAVSAAFIQQEDYYNQAGWDLGVFGDEQKCSVEIYETPKQVESAVNIVWKGNTLVTPIGGGVHVEPLKSLDSQNLLKDDENVVQKARAQVTLKDLPAGQWWWD